MSKKSSKARACTVGPLRGQQIPQSRHLFIFNGLVVFASHTEGIFCPRDWGPRHSTEASSTKNTLLKYSSCRIISMIPQAICKNYSNEKYFPSTRRKAMCPGLHPTTHVCTCVYALTLTHTRTLGKQFLSSSSACLKWALIV